MRVRRLIEYYDNQTEEEAIAEAEWALNENPEETTMTVPHALVPIMRKLITDYYAKQEQQ